MLPQRGVAEVTFFVLEKRRAFEPSFSLQAGRQPRRQA